MELTTITLIGAGLFLLLMFLKMPIGLSMALAGFTGIGLVRGIGPALDNVSVIAYSTLPLNI